MLSLQSYQLRNKPNMIHASLINVADLLQGVVIAMNKGHLEKVLGCSVYGHYPTGSALRHLDT